MAFLIKNGVIINDERELVGVNTAGITTALYVGESISADAVSGIITATSYAGSGADLTDIDARVIVSDGIPTGISTAEGDLYYDSTDLTLFTYYDNNWVDAAPVPPSATKLSISNALGVSTVIIDLPTEILKLEGTVGETEVSLDPVGKSLTVGLANNIAIAGSITANAYYGDGSNLTGVLSTDGGGDATLSGHLEVISLEATGAGVALTVTNDASVGGNLVMTGEIHGPAELIIDPAGIGDNTGAVRIKGDLYVDGTEFTVNSTTVNIADKNIGIATDTSTDLLLDGAGFTIGESGSGVEKTFQYNNTASTFESSVGLGVTAGGSFKAGVDEVLNLTTLGTTVLNSSLTSVGELTDLTVAGDITANGNILGDAATNISGINSVTASDFYGSGEFLTNINAANVDLSGTNQSLNSLVVTGPGIGLTVDNSVSVGSSVTAASFFGPLTGDVTGNLTGDVTAANVSASSSVTSVEYYGGSLNITNDGFIGGNLEVDGSFGFTGDVTTVVAISTDISGANTNTELVTALAVEEALGAFNTGSATTVTSFDDQTNSDFPMPFLSAAGVGVSIFTDSTTLEEFTYNPATGTLKAKEFDSLSDARLKTQIVDIEGAIDKVANLRGVEYDWLNGSGSSVGVIAQEVQEVYPQLVSDSGERLTVNYNGLVGLLISAVNEMAVEIAELKAQK